VIIEPLLGKLDMFDFERSQEAIEEGYRSVERVQGSIELLLQDLARDHE
jgi:hypothetical protein